MLSRWHSHTMQAIANRGEPGPKRNQLWYWASEKVTLYSEANVVRHTYADGRGIITYDYAIEQVPWSLRGTPITAVQVPDTATGVGNNAFYQCSSLASAILPDGIASVGAAAFWYTPLAVSSLPASLKIIGQNAFRACPLTLAALSATLETIGNNAFYQCSGLTFGEMPATVKEIRGTAFAGCVGLTSLTFLGTPTSISTTSFGACANLATIRVPWAEGAVANAPWGATNATITYNYTPS